MIDALLSLVSLALALTTIFFIMYVAGRNVARRDGRTGLRSVLTRLVGPLRIGALGGSRLAGRNIARFGMSRSPRVLAPGDTPPSPERSGDYWDYRGVARPGELRELDSGQVRLGAYLHPRGRPGRELWLPASLLRQGCAVVGPPGSGKTESIIVPWTLQLLRAGSSVVVVDVKGDLLDTLAPEAQTLGRVWYWNASDGSRSQSWNWLRGIVDVRDIEAATQSIIGRRNPSDSQPFFYDRDYRWLRALIAVTVAAYGHGAKPRDLYTLVADQQELRNVFAQFPAVRQHSAEVADLLQIAPQEHSRATSGLLNALHLFNTPEVARVTERNEFDLARLATQPTLLVIGAPLAGGRFSEVLSSMMINRLFTLVYRRFGSSGSGSPLPLVFMLDEAARLKDRMDFEEILSVARSADAGVCLALQNVSQFGDQREAAAVLDNCRSFLVLRGCSPDTAKYFGARLGQRVERIETTSRPHRRWMEMPTWDRSIQPASVPVLAEREIMHPPMGEFVGIAQVAPVSASPFLVELVGRKQSDALG